jgi:D-arabinose 1-dehydrogenase-like Zn-dependent alcohol dehydrogenase
MVKTDCLQCGWKGVAEIKIVKQRGITMEIANCPVCHSDLYCRTLSEDNRTIKQKGDKYDR